MNVATYFPGINPVEILGQRASQLAVELGQKSSQFAVEHGAAIAAHPELSVLAGIALFSVGAVAYKYFQGEEQVSSEEVEEAETEQSSELAVVLPSAIQEVEDDKPVVATSNEASVQVYEENGHQLTVRTSPGFYSYEYVGNGATVPSHMAQIILKTQLQFGQTLSELDWFFAPIQLPVIFINW